MKNIKLFEEFFFSKPDDDIIDRLIKDIKDENYDEIYGPASARRSSNIYSTKINGKELEIDDIDNFLDTSYDVYYGGKKLVCSDSKKKKLYKLLTIDTKGKRELR